MAYVIAEPCINVKDRACVEVCPVDLSIPAPRRTRASNSSTSTRTSASTAEHRAILEAVGELVKAGEAEGRPEATAFAEKLKLHAATEEEVLYPAAILVGEYLKRAL